MQKFRAFFDTHYAVAVSVAASRLNSFHDGEEIATEAFRIAWIHYQTEGVLDERWLFGVVRNLVGDEYRKRAREERLRERLREDLELQPATFSELGAYSDVRDAVSRLPPVYRDVLKMTYCGRLTAKDISDILKIEATGVRTRLMRARRLLRVALDDTSGPTD